LASWQYDFHLLPANAAIRYFGTMPATVSGADLDEVPWWKLAPEAVPAPEQLNVLLPKLESWNNQMTRWGTEDGDRVDAIYGSEGLDQLFVRVDVRRISFQFVLALLSLSRALKLVLRLPNGHVMSPSARRLLESIKRSDSYKFVADPDLFLRALDEQRDGE
jgi:hypothetical protein